MIARIIAAMIGRTPALPQPINERHVARKVASKRQHQSYADRRAAECRAARLRMTGEQA